MSKERLEKIRDNFRYSHEYTEWKLIAFDRYDIEWLIEQAERLHGTEHRIGLIGMYADCNQMVGDKNMEIADLEAQNNEYSEALETVTIPKSRYEELINDEIYRIALEKADISGWEGYWRAEGIYEEDLEKYLKEEKNEQ